MKHFRIILAATRITVAVLFAANVFFMVQLYNSIKARYIDDVEQSLCRAEQIEIVERISKSGFSDSADMVAVALFLKKSDVGDASTVDELAQAGYSQGYRRPDKQLLSEITPYLHPPYDAWLGEPDIAELESAFKRDLNFSGYYPETVLVVGPDGAAEFTAGLWEIVYRVDDGLTYYAYISPLTGNILGEMSGVIASSALIALVLTFGFWYLLHVIERLRTIEEMKDDFTNNMTHELKTPIAIAYAANDALLQYPEPSDEERTRRYLTAALDQLSKLSGLVENILAMSMERRRHLVMSKEKIRLKEFLSAIAEQQKLGAGKPCDIELHCADDVSVWADPTHFSNVIGNLIENSIKYSGPGVAIAIKADDNGVSVEDNGPGIPEKSLPYIFNKFYRVPRGNTAEVRGYGIGLFYVKSIVDKHGWRISADSRPGKGCKFTITFRV